MGGEPPGPPRVRHMKGRRSEVGSAVGAKEEQAVVDPFDGAVEPIDQARHEVDGSPARCVVAAQLSSDTHPRSERFADCLEVVETVHREVLPGRRMVVRPGHHGEPRGPQRVEVTVP